MPCCHSTSSIKAWKSNVFMHLIKSCFYVGLLTVPVLDGLERLSSSIWSCMKSRSMVCIFTSAFFVTALNWSQQLFDCDRWSMKVLEFSCWFLRISEDFGCFSAMFLWNLNILYFPLLFSFVIKKYKISLFSASWSWKVCQYRDHMLSFTLVD